MDPEGSRPPVVLTETSACLWPKGASVFHFTGYTIIAGVFITVSSCYHQLHFSMLVIGLMRFTVNKSLCAVLATYLATQAVHSRSLH